MFLGGRSHFSRHARSLIHTRRIHRREHRESHVQRRLHRPYRPRRSRRSGIRPRPDPLLRLVKSLLGESRPHATQPPGAGLGGAVPLRHLLPHAPAAERSPSLKRITGERAPLFQTNRYPNRAGSHVLSRRGLPPAISRKTRPRQLPYQGVKDEWTLGGATLLALRSVSSDE